MQHDKTLVAHVADVLKANMNNKIYVNTNAGEIRIKSITTQTVHKLTFQRV